MAQRIAGGLRGRGLPGRLIVFAALLATGLSAAAADVLAIVPDVSEPYRAVLYQIVDGMRRSASVRLVQIPSGADPGRPAVTVEGERVVIALGGTAAQAADALRARLPVVVGAVVAPTGIPPLPGVSLETDPEALFKHLTALLPTIRTVHWLYRPERSGWMLDRAQAAARNSRLKLVVVAVDSARSAAQRYQEILDRADSQSDAVWLSQDPALMGADSTLPDILGRAWARNIVIFSGSVQHVSHGVLFALYPDNRAMGESLARMALAHAGGAPFTFEPNRALHSAINRRTAEHLGIAPELARYDLVLPAR